MYVCVCKHNLFIVFLQLDTCLFSQLSFPPWNRYPFFLSIIFWYNVMQPLAEGARSFQMSVLSCSVRTSEMDRVLRPVDSSASAWVPSWYNFFTSSDVKLQLRNIGNTTLERYRSWIEGWLVLYLVGFRKHSSVVSKEGFNNILGGILVNLLFL